MKRRRILTLAAVASLLIGSAGIGAVVFVTSTQKGQRWLTDAVKTRLLSPNCRCTWEVGNVSVSLFNGLAIDSLNVFDEHGELFFSARRIEADYHVRDLTNGRLHLRRVALTEPYLHIRQFENDQWNYKRIFKLGERQSDAERGRFAVVVFDSVGVTGGKFDLSLPWRPEPRLRGAARDSAIREHLGRTDQIFEKTADGFAHRRHWRNADLALSRIRVAYPDSSGTEIVIQSLDVDENDPPFNIRNARGRVSIRGDSLWADLPHFDLPGSTGSATGKIVWGSDLPIRYDLAIRADSVSLADVAWVYPTLPRTGGGKLMLYIRNDPRDLSVIDYRLAEMDVRSVRSHLTGEMTFGVGGPVLGIKNVNLVADPVDFDLIRELSGSPFPVDWRGQLFGTVRGRGGPLTDFVVDAASLEWRDTHVAGAVSRFGGSGRLNVVDPALTVFRGFRAEVASLDLRSIQYLFPSFPRLNGTISGVATLDSVWTRVRFSNADLIHRDGPGEPTHVTGRGTVVTADIMEYDVELEARRISFDMLRRSYDMPFEGEMSGPIRARGSAADLALTANLRGAAGAASFEGRVDVDPEGGYGAHGSGQVAALDLSRLLVDPSARRTSLNGRYEIDLAGPTPARLEGRLLVDLGASQVDTLRIDRGRANVRFADGQARLAEPLTVTSRLARLEVRGGIGLPGGRPDSLTFSLRDINLAELRSYFPSLTAADSLTASALQIDSGATVTGRLDSLRVRGSLSGTRVAASASRLKTIAAVFDLELGETFRARRGIVNLKADSVLVGGIQFRAMDMTLDIQDSTQGRFRAFADAGRRPDVVAGGSWRSLATGTDIRLDSAAILLPDSEWRLAAPSSFLLDSSTTRIGSVVFRNGRGGELRLAGNVPMTDAVSLAISGSGIPLANVADVAQLKGRFDGTARFDASIGGTRLEPVIQVTNAMLDSLGALQEAASLGFGRASLNASYRDNRLRVGIKLLENDRTTVDAEVALPVELTLFSYRNLGDSLTGTFTANDASLRVFQPLIAGATLRDGRINGSLDFRGRWTDPRFYGRLALAGGVIGIDSLYTTYRDVAGTVQLRGDSISIVDSISARSGDRRRARHTATLTGSVWANGQGTSTAAARWRDPSFDLAIRATNFEVLRDPFIVEISTDRQPLTLTGRLKRATLSGAVRLPFARILIPETDESEIALLEDFLIASRVDDDDRNRYGIVDTLLTNMQFANLRLELGDDVRLRSVGSDVVDVKLAGRLEVRNMNLVDETLAAMGPRAYRRIGLYGELQPVSGSVKLDLGALQRSFSVLGDGYIRFDGASKNPELNVSARTSVRLVGRQEQRLAIIATLSGRLVDPGPTLRFRAEDQSFEISESDVVSYLLFGQPSFALEQGAWVTLTTLAGSTTSAWLSNFFRQRLPLDALQFEGASSALAAGSLGADAFGFLTGARVSAEKQVGSRAFATLSTGLCQIFRSPDQFDPNAFGQGLGGSLTYRLSDEDPDATRVRKSTSLRLSVEPALAAQFCTPGMVGLSGLAPTPRQTTISLLNSWWW